MLEYLDVHRDFFEALVAGPVLNPTTFPDQDRLEVGRLVDSPPDNMTAPQEGLLTRVSRGPVEAVDRARMIRRWADDYSVLKSNEALSFLDPRGIANLLRRLPTSRVRYAVTGSLAANRLAPVAPARLAMVYLDDPDQAANDLNLTATDTGANVMLLTLFDEVVFDRTRTDESVTYVAPSQAAVDLLTSPGRSPAEGEAVLEWMARNPPS